MNEFNELKRKALEKYFCGLNDMQKKAVFRINGPLLILAGAGSGKTTVLINRIANMIYFGDAYSYEDPLLHSADELQFLKDYADGKTDDAGRLSAIVSHNPVSPWNILAITFTNKAANELKERLCSMLGERGQEVGASTFHSACARILRRECSALGYSPNFSIYDSDDSVRTIKICLKELGLSDKFFPPKSMLSIISAQKNAMISPQEYYETNRNDFRAEETAKIYLRYNQKLIAANAMDFDDILLGTVRLFQENPDVLKHYQRRYKYISVDEYQDTNPVQFKLVKALSGSDDGSERNLCVVGDDDQSIYKFRGATIENILSFEKTFGCDPENGIIKLEQNYRSTLNILNTANSVISNNSARNEKNLWSDLGEGEHIVSYRAATERSEARYIAQKIKENVENGGNYRDNAVLYRINAQSNIIEQVFTRENIPYRVFGGLKFYDRKEIKDVTSYLTALVNPSDTMHMRRIINEPKRGIGEATATAVEQIASDLGITMTEVMRNSAEFAPISKKSRILTAAAEMFDELTELSQTLKPSELLDEILSVTGYGDMLKTHGDDGKARLENISELKSTMINYEQETDEPDLEGFLEEISLYTDIDGYDPDADCVSLMTIHSAKGLEFENVFVPGMEENIFPSARSSDSPEDVEEERRLAYVAITRAKKKLCLSHAAQRMLFGRSNNNRASRFLGELDDSCADLYKEEPSASAQREKPKKPDYSHEAEKALDRRKNSMSRAFESDFRPGDPVLHPNPKFGRGVILSSEEMGGDTLLEIAFDSCGTKKIMANYVRLKKL